jgi:hemolysin III
VSEKTDARSRSAERPGPGPASGTAPSGTAPAVAAGDDSTPSSAALDAACGASTTALQARPRPLLRGVSHEVFFFISLVTGPLLGLDAKTTASRLCVSVYALTTTLMLGTSAAFHRRMWSPVARRRMRRADHSMIFVFIAGTYTAVAGLALSRGWATIILSIVWAGAIAGIVIRLAWTDAPKWAVAAPYLALGWVAVVPLPELVHSLGGLGFALMLSGGLCYTVGAIAYARKGPDPWPRVFGYHEIFHALVVVAVILHFCLVAFIILPRVNA